MVERGAEVINNFNQDGTCRQCLHQALVIIGVDRADDRLRSISAARSPFTKVRTPDVCADRLFAVFMSRSMMGSIIRRRLVGFTILASSRTMLPGPALFGEVHKRNASVVEQKTLK